MSENKYLVEQDSERSSSGSYHYHIFINGTEVAEFTHDYRGDCESLVIHSTGHKEDPPFGRVSDFISGGGPQPLSLTVNAIKHLEKLLDHA